MDSYITVEAPATAELVEKRSRFIGEICPVATEAEAAEFLAQTRAAHWDARHHCSAWVLRAGGVRRYSDDGEPQGTAGLPMLEVLLREGIEDAAVVVTRYFGGTLLGTGGLVRAYTQTAKRALENAVRVEICRCQTVSLPVPYPLYDQVRLLLEEYGAVCDADFGEMVTVRARLRARDYDPFLLRLTELSSGAVAPAEPEECYSRMPSGAAEAE